MTQTYEVGVRLNADGSGLVAQSKASAEGLDRVGDSTRKLADESRRGAEAAMKAKEADAARRFESSEVKKQLDATTQSQVSASAESENFVRSLKAQADTLGMTKIQIEHYKAAQLDLNTQQKASVKASLDQISAHDKESVAMKDLTRLSIAAGAAIGAYVVSTTLQVKAVIDQADGFNKLSQSMGVSTQFLSAYTYQGQLAGVSQQEMSASARTLVKNMQEAAAGTGNGAAVFRALGGDILQAAKSGESLETLLPRIADRFAQFEDGPRKSALAIELFGRAGERMIPLLNSGAAGFKASAREAAEFGRIIGPDMAKRSEEFNDNLARMNALFTASKFAIAENAVKPLNDYLNKLIEISKLTGGPITGGAAMLAVSGNEAANPGAAVAEMRRKLAAVEKQREDLDKANPLARAFSFDDKMILDAQIAAFSQKLGVLKVYQRQSALAGVDGVDTGDQVSRMMQRARTQAPVIQKEDRDSGRPAAETVSDYERIIAAINQKNAVQQVEESIGARLTASQRDALKIMTDLRDGTISLTNSEKQNIVAVLEGTIASENANLARERSTKEIERLTQAHAKWLEKEEQATARLEDQNTKLADHNRTIGLSAAQLRALTISRAEEALAIARQAEELAALDQFFEGDINMMRRRTQAAQEFLDLTREGAARTAWAEQTKAMAEDNKRMTDNFERGLTDSIIRGFDKGKSFGQNFVDSLKNTFKSAILTPIIQPIVRPFAGAITGLVQGAMGSLFPGGGGGAGSIFGAASGISGANTLSGWLGGPTIGKDSLAGWFSSGGAATAGAMGAGALGSGMFVSSAAGMGMGVGVAGTSAMGAGALGGGLTLGGGMIGGGTAMGAGAIGSGLAVSGSAAAGMGAGAFTGLAAIPGWGWAALAAAAVLGGGLLDGGGPKQQDLYWNGGNFGADNITSQNPAFYNKVNAYTSQIRADYTPEQLSRLNGISVSAPAGADENQLFAQLQQAVAAAMAGIKSLSQTAADAAQLTAAQHQLDISLMEAQGDAAGALAARRKDELAAMHESLRATAQQIHAAQDLTRARQAEATATGSLQSAVSGLSSQLGIDSLKQAQQALATSDYGAPLDRVKSARDILDATYASAVGGDLNAVQAFPQQLQNALAIARDTFASGPEFQRIMAEDNAKLNDLLTRQQNVQTDLLRDVPLTIQQAANDQITALKTGFSQLVEEILKLRGDVRALAG